MNKRRIYLRRGLMTLGCLLMILAAELLAAQLLAEHRVKEKLPAITRELAALLANPTAGFQQSDLRMPTLELEGEQICGLLECDDTALPVFAEFDRQIAARRPAVYSGSVYDGSLVLGGSEKTFGFLQKLEGGEEITFTDLRGRCYAYRVESIRHSRTLAEGLESADLTLYVKINGGYLIADCRGQ